MEKSSSRVLSNHRPRKVPNSVIRWNTTLVVPSQQFAFQARQSHVYDRFRSTTELPWIAPQHFPHDASYQFLVHSQVQYVQNVQTERVSWTDEDRPVEQWISMVDAVQTHVVQKPCPPKSTRERGPRCTEKSDVHQVGAGLEPVSRPQAQGRDA